jgi:hypothetical protein
MNSTPLGVAECNPKDCWKLAGENISGGLAMTKSSRQGRRNFPETQVANHGADEKKTSNDVSRAPLGRTI